MRIKYRDKLPVMKRRGEWVRIPAKRISGPIGQIENYVKNGKVDYLKHSIVR